MKNKSALRQKIREREAVEDLGSMVEHQMNSHVQLIVDHPAASLNFFLKDLLYDPSSGK